MIYCCLRNTALLFGHPFIEVSSDVYFISFGVSDMLFPLETCSLVLQHFSTQNSLDRNDTLACKIVRSETNGIYNPKRCIPKCARTRSIHGLLNEREIIRAEDRTEIGRRICILDRVDETGLVTRG